MLASRRSFGKHTARIRLPLGGEAELSTDRFLEVVDFVQTSSVVECRRCGRSPRGSGSRRALAARPAVDCSFAPIPATSSSRGWRSPLSGSGSRRRQHRGRRGGCLVPAATVSPRADIWRLPFFAPVLAAPAVVASASARPGIRARSRALVRPARSTARRAGQDPRGIHVSVSCVLVALTGRTRCFAPLG